MLQHSVDVLASCIFGDNYFSFVVFIRNYAVSIFRIQELMRITDEYSYYVNLAHMIWIIGPFSVLELSVDRWLNLLILIFLVIMSSICLRFVSHKLITVIKRKIIIGRERLKLV